MAFKYSDYLFTPSDIFRGVLYVLKNLRPVDVFGEAIIFLILICTKQILGWEIGFSLLPALLFAIFYWGKPRSLIASSRKGLSYAKKNISSDNFMGVLILIIFFLYTRDYMFWQIDSILFPLFFFSIFYWNLDSRIPIALALFCLTTCPILLYLSNRYIFLQGEEWAERAAVWAFFFLVMGVAKQVWDLYRENRKKTHCKEQGLYTV